MLLSTIFNILVLPVTCLLTQPPVYYSIYSTAMAIVTTTAPYNMEQLIDETKKHRKHIKIASQNIRSIRRNFDEVHELLLTDADIDVLLLQEVWLDSESSLADLQIPGFFILYKSQKKQ